MIRLAQSKDIKSINELGLLLNPKFDRLFNMKEILKEAISKVYVYEKDGKVVAFLHVTILYETTDIINIVVSIEERRKGIASLLLDYLLSDVGLTASIITLEVNENNKEAVELYEKFGFEIINKRKNYYGTETAYLMGKGKIK